LDARTYYPENGFWAVCARAAFLGAILVVTLASLVPVYMVPQLLTSRHLEHFAAFYITALVTAAAWPRMTVVRLGSWLGLFAGLLELTRMAPSQHRIWGVLDWEADFGGILAALTPIVIAHFRLRFAPRPPA